MVEMEPRAAQTREAPSPGLSRRALPSVTGQQPAKAVLYAKKCCSLRFKFGCANPAACHSVLCKRGTSLTTPDIPSAEQLNAQRLSRWHQAGTPLLTLDSLRSFVSANGLLLFTARPGLLAAPAPTFVEATLGAPNANPTLAALEVARDLLGSLVLDGSVVPLNLLGAPGTTADSPDFLVSSQVLPYIFTLRGDKAWKQPPANSGAAKVSPLALNTYTLLTENGPRSAYDLVSDLGKEVTEAAVLRALSELWQHLRVLPGLQTGSAPTLWEPIGTRFTKQVKAGANAGQPTALSALITLYLGQAILSTEDEIETFLSPLAPRSRVRDVLHAFTAARELDTLVIEGKTYLHIAGDLPVFTSAEAVASEPAADAGETDRGGEASEPTGDGRIRKFVPRQPPRKVGTGFPPKRPAAAAGDRDRRPFQRSGPPPAPGKPFGKPFPRSASESSGRPAFNRPWDEEKQARAPRPTPTPNAEQPPSAYQDMDLDAAGSDTGPANRPARPGRSFPPNKRPFQPASGQKPRFGGDRPAFNRDSRPDRPFDRPDRPSGRPDRDNSAPGRPPRRDFPPRSNFSSDTNARPRRTFPPRDESSRPASPRQTFPPRDESSRPASPRRTFPPRDESSRPAFRKFDAPRGPAKPFTPREGSASRPPRTDFAKGPRSFTKAPRDFSKGRPDQSSGRPTSGPRKPFTPPKASGAKPFGARPSGPSGPFKKPGRFTGDAPGANTFDKFKGGAKGGVKPWGKRTPARKFKPGPDTPLNEDI